MRKKFFLTICFSLLLLTAFAQYNSLNGRFQVAERSGCTPFDVTITINAPYLCDGANPCGMDYGAGDGFNSLDFDYTYAAPGIYWIRVLFGAVALDSLQVEVFADTPPTFELYACGGNQVNYSITDTGYDQYVVDFNDGSPVEVVSSLATGTHAYATSGSKTVTVTGLHNGALNNCTPASQTFNAVPTLAAPAIDRLTVTGQSGIQLDFTTDQFVQYRLEIATNNASTFQFVQNVYNQNTATLNNLTPDNNYYCFRLGAYDPCNNLTYYSNTICSANFDLTVLNNTNSLNWTTAGTPAAYNATVNQYRLLRDGAPYLLIPKNLNAQNDIDIVCNTTYCYQLIIAYNDGSESYSLEKCGTSFSTDLPTPVQNITSIVAPDNVTLEWAQDPDYVPAEYTVLRSENNATYQNIGNTATQTFTDPAYASGESMCYRITYTDMCGNQSVAGIAACPIRLSGTLQSDNSIALAWTGYEGWQNGVGNYVVEKYTAGGVLLETFDAGSATTFTDDASGDVINQVYVYVVRANANDTGFNQSVSNTITIVKEPNLYYPTAFTPNGDGLNDVFRVFGQYITGFEMKIFNRWGEMVYSTADITQGWNGTFRGKEMPEGTYVFKADLTDLAGRTFNRSGSVLLLRKK